MAVEEIDMKRKAIKQLQRTDTDYQVLRQLINDAEFVKEYRLKLRGELK